LWLNFFRIYGSSLALQGGVKKHDPNDANAYYNRGVAYRHKGQKDMAIRDLEKAVQLDPNDQWAKDLLREIRGW
jgi:tetratricopeptide (TPR) repeat protein